MYAKADFDDEDTRNQVLEYFVDKIYVYNDRLVITWYYSDDKTSIDLDALTEITETSESNTVDRGSTLLQSGLLLKPLILLYFQGFQNIKNWFQIILHHFEPL